MLKRFLSVILTAMLITSVIFAGTSFASPLTTKTVDFETETADVTGILQNAASFNVSRIATSDGEITFPESTGDYVLKITDKEIQKQAITVADMNDMADGIIEHKMDFYFNVNEKDNGIGLSMQTEQTGYTGRNVLWKTVSNDSSIKILGDAGNRNSSVTSFVNNTWYTFKTIINIDKKIYNIFYKESNAPDIHTNYSPVVFPGNIKDIEYSDYVTGVKVSELRLYCHVVPIAPQYVDNISVKSYATFVAAVNAASTADEMEQTFKEYAEFGEITLSPKADYTKLFNAINDKVYTYSADIQKDYDLLLNDGDMYAELNGDNLSISFINQVNLSSGCLILAAYNGGVLTGCEVLVSDTSDYQPTSKFEKSIASFESKGDTLYIFAWESTDSDITPLAKKASVKK